MHAMYVMYINKTKTESLLLNEQMIYTEGGKVETVGKDFPTFI